MNMSTHDQATTDNTHPAEPTAQRKTGSSIGDKASGLANIIHGTGEVIRGHALETGDLGHGHGDGKAIAAAGREQVERGLNKIEGKHARTSEATDAHAHNGGGPHDVTGAGAPAPVQRDPNAPQASAAAPRAEPSAWKARLDASDTNGHPVPAASETGTHAGGAVGGPGSDQRTDEQIAAPALPARGDRPTATATDDPNPNVQHDTDGVESMTAPGNLSSKQTRPSTNLPLSGETGGPGSDQHTDGQFAAPHAPPGDYPAAGVGPNVQHDAGVPESRPVPVDTGKQTRPTTDLPLSGETAPHPEVQSSGTGVQMEQRSGRPAVAGSG